MHALTPSHAPPEVLEGKKATELSDVYSLASTLYVLLAGRPAFSMGADPSILQFLLRVTSDPVPPIPRADVPQVVQDVLIAAMAKDPAYRYQSAAELGKALQQLQAHLGYPVTELVTLVPMPGATPAATLAPPPAPAPAPSPVTPAAPPAASSPAAPPAAAASMPTGTPRAAQTGPAPQFAPAPPDPTFIPPPAPAAFGDAPGAERPTTGPVAPPPPPAGFGGAPASPDATMLRPGTGAGTGGAGTGTGGGAGAGVDAAGGNGAGRGGEVPTAAVAPPLPSPDLYGGPDTGSATVYHERAVPVIEAADLTPPSEASKPSPVLRTVAVVVVLVLLIGIGYLAVTRLKGSSTTDATAPTSAASSPSTTTPANGPSTTGGGPDSSVTATTATTGTSGGVTTTGGSTGGTITAPENVAVKVLANESVQVTWSDPSGGKAPYVYEVVSPDGQVLSKISAVGPGTTSTVVTETNNGPLKTESTTYCVAVGAIGGPGKPLWAPAPCTDGTTITVS